MRSTKRNSNKRKRNTCLKSTRMEVTAISEKTGISNDVLIEIVHSIKDIIVALIDRAFPRGSHKQDEYEKIYNQ